MCVGACRRVCSPPALRCNCALEGETVEVFWLTIDEGNDDDQPDYLG
jgi:hypothetical protein